jgi:hypothetical protein
MTRRTFEETKESLEFMEQVDSLSQQQRDHLRIVVKKIIACYVDPKHHAVIVVGNDDSEQATLLTINADEMEAATILAKLEGMFYELNTVGAPPKEMMN